MAKCAEMRHMRNSSRLSVKHANDDLALTGSPAIGRCHQ